MSNKKNWEEILPTPEGTYYNYFSNELRWTRQEIATICGISVATLNNYLATRRFSASSIDRMLLEYEHRKFEGR